ncbi:hypothetical protein [uncultured Stenotrophomonas sp.]|nr:hypothetical protein [uncultured Stenotrophomonas sp.]
MTKNELFDRIVRILKDSFEIEPVRITPQAACTTIWTSTASTQST